MRTKIAFASLLLLASMAAAQNPSSAPASAPVTTANYSVMLVPPPNAGEALVLFHNPSGALELVPVSHVTEKFQAGYVPVRAAEIGEIIQSLKEENTRLKEENARLIDAHAPTEAVAPPPPSRQDNRRQMLMQWLMMQNRPQTYNMNVTVRDCTKYPALCAGR